MSWIVNFREKGSDPRVGGYWITDDKEERDKFTATMKEHDLKVVWEELSAEA